MQRGHKGSVKRVQKQGKFVLHIISFQWQAVLHEFLVIRKESRTERTLRVSSRIF